MIKNSPRLLAARRNAVYYKPVNSPQLLAKNFPYDDDRHIELTQAEFLARAWRLANDQARELRWILQKKGP